MNIVNLDDHRPHLTIQTDSAVHVVPKSVFYDIASGKLDIEQLEEWKSIYKAITKDWLKTFGEPTKGEDA